MKNLKKKILATIVSIATAIAMFATPVCAANTDAPVEQENTARQSVGDLIAGSQATIHGGSGVVEVYLSSGNWWTDIMCGTASTGAVGSVSCYVTFPNGTTTYLGTIDASGDHTDYMEFSHCPAGTYKFAFEGNTSDTYDVYARMYD